MVSMGEKVLTIPRQLLSRIVVNPEISLQLCAPMHDSLSITVTSAMSEQAKEPAQLSRLMVVTSDEFEHAQLQTEKGSMRT
jgi:hypothetical protein